MKQSIHFIIIFTDESTQINNVGLLLCNCWSKDPICVKSSEAQHQFERWKLEKSDSLSNFTN